MTPSQLQVLCNVVFITSIGVIIIGCIVAAIKQGRFR